MLTFVMFSATLLAFVRVTGWDALVVPTIWSAKATPLVEKETCAPLVILTTTPSPPPTYWLMCRGSPAVGKSVELVLPTI
jgi:hypothetical protein